MLLRSMRYPFAATRARALATRFLGEKDFEELSQLPSLDKALARLREKTVFRAEFYRTGEGLNLEFLDFGRLISRSLSGRATALVKGYLGWVDVENLKVVSRGLLAGRSAEDFHPLLIPGGVETRLSPENLRKAGSFEELAGSLPIHSFGKIFRKALELPEDGRLFHLETGLDHEFWCRIGDLLGKLSLFERRGAGDILGFRADIDRFNLIHRGWRAGLEDALVLNVLPPMGSIYRRGWVREALRSSSPADALSRMFPLPHVPNPLSSEGETALWRRLYHRLQRALRSHPFNISVPLASLLLKEIEIRDLEVVLNGLRLKRGDNIDAFLAARRG